MLTPNEYFMDCTKKVYIELEYKIESFEEYLNHIYKEKCYYYSLFALMGMKKDDYLVRGNIDIPGYIKFHHGWVEFLYQDKWYVFDSMINGITPKYDWYKRFNPRIDYKKTQKEILDTFLNEKNAVEFDEGIWQFKYYVTNEGKEHYTDNEYKTFLEPFYKANGFVPNIIKLSRITLYNDNVVRFIAYDPPCC